MKKEEEIPDTFISGDKSRIVSRMLLPLLLLVLLNACSGTGMMPPPVISPEAQHRLGLLENFNRGLRTFKGVGNFRLENEEGVRNARVAWIGSDFRKLRIRVLDISGIPIVSIAADGGYFYALSHKEKRFYKQKTSDPKLKKAIGIPISTREAIRLLTGRVPIRGHDAAQMGTGKEDMLILTSRWGRVLEKIYFDPETQAVSHMEMYSAMGNLLYQVSFGDIRKVDNYQLPFALDIRGEDVQFRLRIERYWADVPLSPSVFVLEDPDQ